MGNGCATMTPEQKARSKKSSEIDSLLTKKMKRSAEEIKLLLLGTY
jgi:hypothetical protein